MESRFLRTGPVEPPSREGPPPFVRMVVAGIGRLIGMVAVGAGISAGIGVLVGWWKGSDLGQAANLGLYLGGAALVAVPLLSWGGQSMSSGGYEILEVSTDPEYRRLHQSKRGVYLLVGVIVLLLGVLVETQR